MIQIVEVKTKKQIKAFTYFPLKLYKDCPYYVPPFIADEMVIFDKRKNANLAESEIAGFLAYKDDTIVGRIAGILHHTDNKITGKKRVRISRVDFIDDFAVSEALFKAVECWAKSKGMNEVHGPLGFNDLEREGLLIRGFGEPSDFEENYTYPYYPAHFERLGYEKSVDWNEYLIYLPNKVDEKTIRLATASKQRYNLSVIEGKKNKIIDAYKYKIFDLVEMCYSPLYGVVPINEKLKAQFISQFKLLVSMDYLTLVVNEKEELVGFSLVFPSLAKAMQKTKGKILSPHIFSLLKALKKNDTIDLALVAVRTDYQTKGVAAIIMERNLKNFIKNGIKYAETNLQLENNNNIHALFSNFEMKHHKDRRCYIKKIWKEEVMSKVTVVINGVGGCGKDSLIEMLKGKIDYFNVSSITPVKEIAKHCGWQGEKTDKARKFLSDLKQLLTTYNEYPMNYILAEQEKFISSADRIMFVHIREPEEIAKFVALSKTKTLTLLIEPREELQGKIYGNASDDNVSKYPYDLKFANNRPLVEIEPIWLEFVKSEILV